MRLVSIIILGMLCKLVESAVGGWPCPPGMVESACKGACPPACRDEGRVCPPLCVRGCVCANGNVLDYTGRCIQRNQCCAKGFVETRCGANCPRTCADPNGTRPCTAQCVPGCVCAPGTVLNPAGKCVPVSQCSSSCPPGQVESACQGHCPPTCRDEDRACAAQCVPGCVCANGKVFDFTGRCIERRQCCRKGFVETQCGANCPRTCADPNGTRPCTGQCVRGCVCAPGTVLNPAGRCVPPNQC